MIETPKPAKRIVPKSKYVRQVADKAGGMGFGVVLLVLGGCAGFIWFAVLVMGTVIATRRTPPLVIVADLVFVLSTLGYGVWVVMKMGLREVKRASALKTDTPLTKNNLGDLPASETLVRSAEEPEHQQSELLLRAAQTRDETAQEQLLRPR